MRLIDADGLRLEICRDQCERDGCDYQCSEVQYVDNAPTVNRWISVKDRLPEPEEKVLIYTKTGCIKYAKYLDEPNVVNPWYVYEDQARAWTNVISYWMPLPSTEGLQDA